MLATGKRSFQINIDLVRNCDFQGVDLTSLARRNTNFTRAHYQYTHKHFSVGYNFYEQASFEELLIYKAEVEHIHKSLHDQK